MPTATAEPETRTDAQPQQKAKVKNATFARLKKKKRAHFEADIILDDPNDPVHFEFDAISIVAYDKLLTEHPPTFEQQARDEHYNKDTFVPALLSLVVTVPKLATEQWTELFSDQDGSWGRGEVMTLFMTADRLCLRVLDLAPLGDAFGSTATSG